MRIDQRVIALTIVKRDVEEDAEFEKSMKEINDRKDTCKGLEYGKHVTGLVTNLIGDIPDIPLIGDVAKIATSGIAAIAHVAEFGMDIAATALDCDDLNFDEIKLIMDKRFNEVDRKLDKLAQAMEKITDIVNKTLSLVEKTRAEMNWGFKNVLATLKSIEIQTILSRINKFSRYFEKKSNEIDKLPADEYIFQLKEEHGILEYLNKVLMPEGLQADLFELMDKNTRYAIPTNADDSKAFQALYALFYGTQTYASVMFFLLKQHSYLADYYYQNGEDENFNTQFDILKKILTDFKSSLTGSGGVINEVVKTLDDVKDLYFIEDAKDDLYADICNREIALKELKLQITEMKIDVIADVPLPIDKIIFKGSILYSNYSDWDDKPRISYAVQLRENGTYSKFSKWTDAFKIEDIANPTLTVPRDEKNRERLIFRKFNDGKPELAGILTRSQAEFRDIDRDLYNAAKSKDQNRALEYIPILLKANADVHAIFEMKRSAMHAAAETGNVKIALRYLLEHVPVDSQDEKGFTPLHLAANTKNAGFVNFLVTHNANVNAQTYKDKLAPLHLAAKKGYSNAVKNLLESDEIDINQPEKSGYRPLHYAVRGTVKTIKTLLSDNRILVNAKSDTGLTAFHLAVMKGDRDICDALLSSGKVEVNTGDKYNMTPLHFAAMAGNVDMIEYLLSGKKEMGEIEVNAVTTDNNWTPLYTAIFFKKEEAALKLIKSDNVDISIASKENITPLHLSVANELTKVFDELLKKGSNIETRSKEGYTPLHLAAMLKDTSFATKLLDKRAHIDALSYNSSTPLHLAARSDKLTEVTLLLQNGANMRIYNKGNYLPIHYSIRNINSDAVNEFINQERSIIQNNNNDGKSVMNYTNEFLTRSFYDYYAYRDTVKYLKYKDLQPEQYFEKEGHFDLMRSLLKGNPGDHLLECLLFFANVHALWCVQLDYSLLEQNITGKSVCPDMKIETLSPHNFNLDQNYANFYFTKRQVEYNLLSPVQRGSDYSFFHNRNNVAHNVDPNATLLLLDLFVRKLTNEKVNNRSIHKPVNTLESRAMALEITDDFGKYIEAVTGKPAEELVDLPKLHSDLYKALNSGKYYSIGNILSMQAKGLIQPNEEEYYLSVLLPKNFSETEQTKKEYFSSLFESCRSVSLN